MHSATEAPSMQPLSLSEILDNRAYEQVRGEFRAKVLAEKSRRRVSVGPHFTFLFENRLTVQYQVQEMMRIEGIADAKAIRHEVETYNELIPPTGGLSATLMIEYEDPEARARELPRLLGIERHVWLKVGDLPAVAAEFDTRQIGVDRVSAVQYLRFALPDPHRRLWTGLGHSGQIRLAIDHPNYTWEAVISPETAAALAEDLK
jgi:uncharacterized protein DUF3501